MPDLPSNIPGSEPDSPDFSEFSDGGESGDFLGLGQTGDEVAPHATPDPESSPGEPFEESAPEPSASAATFTGATEATDATDEVPEWALEEDDGETMSWLMEFDGEEEGEPSDVFEPSASDEVGEFDDEDQGELEDATSTNGGWLLRGAIAGISLGLGFAGSRYLAQREGSQVSPSNQIARVQPQPDSTRTLPGEPGADTPVASRPVEPRPPRVVVELGPLPSSGELEGPWRPDPTVVAPNVVEGPTPEPAASDGETAPSAADGAQSTDGVASSSAAVQRHDPAMPFTGPNVGAHLTTLPPFLTLSRPSAAEQGDATNESEGPSLVFTQGTGARTARGADPEGEVNHVVRAPGTTRLTDEDLGGQLREASAAELSGLWLRGTIPMDRITRETRLMTPGVGNVRVLLESGEVFEGELYAVGENKVWIRSDRGKMALLAYQVQRIEHVLDATSPEGAAELATNLAGLESVRVRTPGGVFYGRLLTETEDSVTLLTGDGARITLDNAELDRAGHRTTHLVDAAGALPPEDKPEEE